MSLTGFFEGIQAFAEETLFAPFNALAEMELTNWWGANTINWLFMIICCVAIVYWMRKLVEHNAEGAERRDAISHGFLGKDSELDHKL
ncbi:hypothetical protein GCM10011344_22260 [Dokdonia pacifica]|uniref:Uracil phosphoribosyltransferase n=1 Tax=Dokdonia pacifica TaxID=1627892 RepID=A0A238WGW4_9FLAO|nr:uracil phosphoribosyltransferase [Dokdonia pacifica]GGG21031.1 hypothetical protein GCM10011344_22260 [Dokdonia pacifica]SNR45678.1 hypothetical protein SAMN06265376_1011058 [Dokdonia pacifica]